MFTFGLERKRKDLPEQKLYFERASHAFAVEVVEILNEVRTVHGIGNVVFSTINIAYSLAKRSRTVRNSRNFSFSQALSYSLC